MVLQSQLKDKKDKQTDAWYAWARYLIDIQGKNEDVQDPNSQKYDPIEPIAKNKFRDMLDQMSSKGKFANKHCYYVQSGVLADKSTQPYAITVKFRAPIDTSS